MQYNFHNEKYKQSDVGGIRKEQFRDYSDSTKYRNYVDSERTALNEYVPLSENGCDWHERIKDAKAHMEEITGKKLRKDAVVLCSTVESVPTSWPPDVCKSYFDEKAKWYDKYLQEKAGVDQGSMLSVCVHLDETTPHATYAWMPLRDERFQAKNITDKVFLKALQTDSQEYTMDWIGRYNKSHPDCQIEKLEPATGIEKRKHLDELEYKTMKSEEKLHSLEADISAKVKATEEQEHRHAEVSEAVRQKEDEYEKLVTDITAAPDLQSYEDVKNENERLREELSLKDRIIERLEKSIKHWQDVAEGWKSRFETAITSVTEKVSRFFGQDSEEKNNASMSLVDQVETAIKVADPEGYIAGEKVYPGYNHDWIESQIYAGKIDGLIDRLSLGKGTDGLDRDLLNNLVGLQKSAEEDRGHEMRV